MKASVWTLLVLIVLPGAALSGSSTYFLLPDWAMLTVSHQNYQKLAASPTSTVRDLAIAEAAENRHRINCFAEGVGALLGGIIFSIGIHGICTLSTQPYRSS
jgi:uncharacterized membrane protein YedE/YeeE